jgi:hypothetical protein
MVPGFFALPAHFSSADARAKPLPPTVQLTATPEF